MKYKRFKLGAVLTITTGKLLADNGMEDVYDILEWLTGERPFTHQIPRFMQECSPWLLRWHPELEVANNCLDALEGLKRVHEPREAVSQWLAKLELPAEYEVSTIPLDDHERKHPYDELVAMRGSDEGIVVVKTPTNPEATA